MNPSLKRYAGILGSLMLGLALWLALGRKEQAPPHREKTVATSQIAKISQQKPDASVVRIEGAATVAFSKWTERFLAADADQKRAILDEGIALASARRTELKATIAADPERAIASAIPPVIRQQLPRVIAERLEERVNESAFFGVLGALPGAGSAVGPSIRRQVRTDDGANYQAFVFGRRRTQQTTERASIVGIAVDDYLAVDESPLRVVSAGEIPNHPNNLTQRRRVTTKDSAGFSDRQELREQGAARPLLDVCPISNIVTPLPESSKPVADAQPVVEAEGKFQFLCTGGHIHAFRDSLVAREGANGGPSKPTNLPSATQATGYKSNLLMRVAFPEVRKESVSEKEGYQFGKDVEDWFVDSSYGKMSFITTVTPILILPRTEAWYKDVDTSGSSYEVLDDARIAAKAAGFDPANFDFDTVIFTGTPGSFGGQAYVGGKGCWLKSGTGVGVACHEYGHNFGLWHANSWNTSGASIIGAGAHVEYGDNFDTMGSASAGDLQFNACHKNLLGWIPTAQVHSVTTSGTYRIYQMDQPRQDPALRYAMKIRKDGDRDYWVDLRQRSFSNNRWVAGGVFLHWSPWVISEGGSHLLDTTPGSPDDKTDAPIVIGRTFSDFESGIHITPIAKNATVPPSFDVVANLGAFAGNHAPTISVSADQNAVPVSTVVTFTAAAIDADGDAVSYSWDFGDKDFATTNTAVVTKSWATAGDYVVRCVASDMKGGTASSAVVVRVGSPTTFTVSGTITLNGQPLPDVRVHNGLTSASYRGSFTNSDGSYFITGLAAANYTIGAALYGYTFSPVTSAAVSVGPDAANVNFTATESNRVSIVAVNPSVTEGATGILRITRSGPTTSALTVNVAYPSGFAVKGADYTLSPDFTSTTTFYTATIAAGQAQLNITFSASTDTAQEGPETAVFELFPGSGYVIGNSSATITIGDDDTTKPLVRLITEDNDASESGGTGTFVIERMGSTAAALNVAVSLSGTAASGADYASIPSTVTIPAGELRASVVVAPVADSLVEGEENVTLSIATNSAYVRPSSSADYTGTVTISDAQSPVVSIVASDAAASEALNDPGIFVISRTGTTTLPLTVQLGLTGNALMGVDYLAIPAQVTIPAGSDFTTVVVTPIDDGIGEPSQTVRLYLRAANTYTLGTAADATVTISDNADLPYVTVGTTASAKEAGGNGTFKITTQGTGSGTITVNYTVSGTATNGVDFTTLTGSVSIGKNTTTTISVVPIQDTESEGYESVTLTLTPSSSYSLALDRSATLMLEDDELPQVNVSTTDDLFSESTGSVAKFFVSRTGATTAALTVNYTITGTAVAGSDFTAPSGTVTIPAAKTGAYVDIPIIDDAIAEGTETITLQITPDAAYSTGFDSATHFLADGDTPTFGLRYNPNTASVAENAGAFTATVTLSGASAVPVSVQTILNGGTALGGIDYAYTGEVITFAPGEVSKDVIIPILNDTLPESDETISLTLANPTAARLSNTPTNRFLTITINDDDAAPPPTVGFTSTSGSAAESSPTVPLYVTLSSAQTVAITVDFSVTGGTATAADHTIVAGTLTFAPGEIAKLIPNSIVDDGDQETNETIIVSLSNPTGPAALSANSTYTYTILDDDTMTVSIAATNGAAAEPGTNDLLTISRSGATGNPVTVNLTASGTAAGGNDYAALPATVTLAAGASTATIPVSVIDDNIGEGSETVIVTIAAGPYSIGTPNSATVTIADDEPLVTIVASDASAAEVASEPGSIVITRSGSTTAELALDVTIGGTATSGADYGALTLPFVFPIGSNSLTVPIVPVDDTLPEGMETVIATLSVGPGYLISGNPTATVTILDDDVNLAPTVAIDSPTVNTVTLPANVGLILEATVTDDAKPIGNPLTSAWSKLSGPGSVTFGSSSTPDTTATFSLPGTYVLRLSANDGALSTNVDLTVIVLGTNAPWTGTNIANATPVGSYTEDAGAFTVQGGGTNISGSSDTFFFVNRPLYGNCDFRARIVSMSTAGTSAKAGVMIRQSTTGNSRGAYMSAYSTGTTATSWRTRTTDGGSWASVNGTGAPSFPRWVRVVKNGPSYSGYTSTNGTTWTQVGTTGTLSTTEPLLIGLGVTSNLTTALCTAVFDNVSITNTGNTAPFASAGRDASTAFPQAVALGGSVSDDSQPATVTTVWEKRSGPGSVTFADASAPATTATFSAPGTYILRLIADDSQVKTFDEVSISADAPLVTLSITASVPTASEFGLTSGAFTISRTGDTSGSLTLQTEFAGTAVSGIDYTTPGTVFTFPSGADSIIVPISPIADSLAEGDETVTMSLSASSAYNLGSATATVTISDLPGDSWRFQIFGPNASDSAVSGDFADPDKDGIVNLLEYAFAQDPLSAELPAAPELSGGELRLTYRRNLHASDLGYVVQKSLDASTWEPAFPMEEILSDDGDTRVIRAHVPVGLDPTMFLRIRVSR